MQFQFFIENNNRQYYVRIHNSQLKLKSSLPTKTTPPPKKKNTCWPTTPLTRLMTTVRLGMAASMKIGALIIPPDRTLPCEAGG